MTEENKTENEDDQLSDVSRHVTRGRRYEHMLKAAVRKVVQENRRQKV